MPREVSTPKPHWPRGSPIAKPGGVRPVEALIAWPRPSASRRGRLERPAPQPVAVAEAQGAGLRDVAERVGALVAVCSRVFRAAAADRVEHDEDGASHVSARSRRSVRDTEGPNHRLILRAMRSIASRRMLQSAPSEPSGASIETRRRRRRSSGRGGRGAAHWLTTPLCVASLAKAAANRARVYSFCGAENKAVASPLSTTLPRRMTMTSLASARTTFRSCEMKR